MLASDRVVVGPGTYRIGHDIVVGPAKTLVFEGGVLLIDAGVNVSFGARSNVEAGRWQIFAGEGTVSNLRIAMPEWFGAVQSTSVNSKAAIAAANESLRNNGVLDLNHGFYAMDGDSPLLCTRGQLILGQGAFATTIRITTAAANLAKWTTTFGGRIAGVRIECVDVIPTSGTLISFSEQLAKRGSIKDVFISGCWNAIDIEGDAELAYNIGAFEDVYVFGVYNRGVYLNWTEGIDLRRVFVNAEPGTAPQGCYRIQNKAQDVNLHSCNASNGSGPSLVVSNDLGAISRGVDGRWNTVASCNFDDANIGIDLNNCEQWRFINCWASSNGRTASGKLGGPGVRVRANCSNIVFQGGVYSNNGQQGFRIDAGAKDIEILDLECANNGLNTASGFWNIDFFGGVTDFRVDRCRIGGDVWGWTGATPIGGVQVRSGASDRYDITRNRFAKVGANLAGAITDSGSGSDKDVSTGNRWRAS